MRNFISLIGLNHRTASVDIREKFSLSEFCEAGNWAIPCNGPIRESLILSTCNRVEILAIGSEQLDNHLLSVWASIANSSIHELLPYIYTFFNKEAIKHIFSVASSIDSMVLGEPQILGQLKKAYRNSVDTGHSGLILNRLLHKSFSVAKRVRNETAIAANAVSISYAAVELAKRIFGEMATHKAMLIGAGEMAELAAMHLLQAGINEIIVVNRTLEHGVELAQKFSGRAVSFEKLIQTLPEVDIIITSTGSQEPILKLNDVKNILKIRKNRPMFFIDIAVPRDIDSAINQLDNIYLYDIDDLKEVVEDNLSARQNEAEKAKKIIDEEVLDFSHWLENLQSKPTILDLIDRGRKIADEEVEKTLKRISHGQGINRQALEVMANAIVRKLNHDPIMFLKEEGMSREGAASRIGLVRRVFNLDHQTEQGKRH